MKILIINYRYFVSGGPERYLFNLKSLLEKKGNTVIPFSINYSKNEYTEYQKYFVSPLSGSDEIYFKDQSWTLNSFLKTMERTFYSREVFNNLCRLIDNEKPDFAIVLAYLRKLSPSVLVALNLKRIPFTVRLSDFSMVCPNAHLIRGNDVCELCLHGSLFNSVRYKCVQNSFMVSLVNYLSVKYHNLRKYFDLIQCFIVPSIFTKNKLIDGGIDDKRIEHVPTFIYPEVFQEKVNKKNQLIYVGRVERIKGVHLLLHACGILKQDYNIEGYPVIIAGNGNKKYLDELKEIVNRYALSEVRFVGNLEKNDLFKMIRESLISVAPSLWYDNSPNSVLESLACGTAVIVPRHGSFLEMNKENETGLFFKPNDPYDLAVKIKYLMENPNESSSMGEKGIKYIEQFHSPDFHYHRLMEIYSRLKDQKVKN